MRRFAYIAAATMAVSGFGLAGCDDDTDLSRSNDGVELRGEVDARPAGEQISAAADRAGDTAERAADRTSDSAQRAADRTGDAAERAADRTGDAAKNAADRADRATDDGTVAPKGTAAAPDAEGIRDVLASSTEAVLTKDGFDDLVERFVDADRNRIGNFADDTDMADLDGLIAQLQKDWQAKYNDEFDIENEEMVFGEQFATIQQGEIGQAARVAGEAMKNNGAPANEQTDQDKNVEPGRNVATVTLKASHGLPDLTVPLIHEMPDNWRINIPDTLDGAKLKQNLMNHLTYLSQHKAEWPADVNDAHRLVSHHVMMALLDQPVSGTTGSKTGSNTDATGTMP